MQRVKGSLVVGSLFFVGSNAMAQDRMWSAFGDKRADWLGWTVSVTADFNGDGTLDVAASMPYSGGAGQLRVLDGRTGAKLFDVVPGRDGVFHSRRLGDVNADGVEDLLIRTRATTNAIRGYSGKDQRLLYSVDGDALPIVVGDVDFDGRPDFATVDFGTAPSLPVVHVRSGSDGSKLLKIAPTGRTSHFCSGWLPLGDWNGDGWPDLAIGDLAGGAAGSGCVHLVSTKDGTILTTIDSQAPHARFGTQLVAMGDLDHDGTDDFAIGATNEDFGAFQRAGVVHFVSGATLQEIGRFGGDADGQQLTMTDAVGDVDGDGFRDFVAVPADCYMMGEPIWITSGRTFGRLWAEQSEFFVDQVSIAGGTDMDGDGRDDVVCGRAGASLRGEVVVDCGDRVFLTAFPKYKLHSGGQSQISSGDPTFSFHAADFGPATQIALELVDVDGVATSKVLATGVTNAIGEWDVRSDFVPPDAKSHLYGCRVVGLDVLGRPIATATQFFGYR